MTDTISRRRAMLQGATAAAGLGLAATLLKAGSANAQQAPDDVGALKALLRAERNAVKTYEAGAGVLDAASSSDPLYAFRGVVKAIALHFAGQHATHAATLAEYIAANGSTDDVGPGAAQIPPDFKPSIANVVALATNAEKAAAITYTQVQRQMGKPDNAALAAAIGAVETQHFVVLNLVANGFVVPPSAVANKAASELGPVAARFAPRPFVLTSGGSKGLEDESLPFYDVTQ